MDWLRLVYRNAQWSAATCVMLVWL